MKKDIFKILKRAVEIAMPNFRHFYRILKKGKIFRTYASDGKYYVDVQILRNDESVDENEPILAKVELPVIWGGENKGIVCPPVVGTLCDVEYYDGDPNFPRISNIRWKGNKAPEVEIGGFIIQQTPETYIKIDASGNIKIKCKGNLDIESSVNIKGDLSIDGNINATGKIIDSEGNTNNHTH